MSLVYNARRSAVYTAFALLVAVASLAAQRGPDERNIPDNEKRIPPNHYCKRVGVPIGRTETRAHSCSCVYRCHVDPSGNVIEAESDDCLAYCHANGRTCTCHVEEPCEAAADDPALVSLGATTLARVPVRTIPGHTAERNVRVNGRRYRLQRIADRWQAVSNSGDRP